MLTDYDWIQAIYYDDKATKVRLVRFQTILARFDKTIVYAVAETYIDPLPIPSWSSELETSIV